MTLKPEVLDDFKRITGRDVAKYLSNAIIFLSGDYNTIVKYYSGNIPVISSAPFKNFEQIEKGNRDIFEAFHFHAKQFNNSKWWLLLEQIEEIDNRLKTLRNINKWARSSATKVAYEPSFQLEYTLSQNETLEDVASAVVLSNNPNDDWRDIAISNRLTEEDYTPEGGNVLSIQLNKVNTGFKITSVVDVISGKSVYGKDVYRKIQFDSTTNDLKVLSYDDTILQAVDILYNLKKKDNPDNPTSGLQSDLAIGANKALFNFPVIIRQKQQTFAGDDTLKNLVISNLTINQDNVMCDYKVETRLGEVIDNGNFQ